MLDFLYTAVSWVLLRWHQLFTLLGLAPTSGVNWALSIIFLVVTARLLLFRLFVKQVKYQRHMQEIQPQLQKLREKYKSDRAELQRQMMQLQQEQGFNPLAGCLPLFLQIPVFISLFHVLRHLSNSYNLCVDKSLGKQGLLTLYSFTHEQTCNASQARLFDAPLAASLRDSTTIIHNLNGSVTSLRAVTIVLVIVSAVATLVTQLLVQRAATTTPTGSAATIQKLMKVFIPISVLFSGFIFPLGVLLYWFTNNSWTMLQQLYINRFHPPTPKEVVEVGTLGKTLAPKPGQRPAREVRGAARPAGSATGGDAGGADAGAGAAAAAVADELTDDGVATPPRPGPPRPGARPQRPPRQGGSRPPGTRPSQAKKRR